jgi:flagellar hook-length control protein FliK
LTAANGGSSGRAGQATAEGHASFHAVLRTAAGAHHPGAADCRPTRPAEAPAGRTDTGQTPASVDSEDSELPVSGTDDMGLWPLLMQALQAMLADAQAGISRPGGSGDAAEIGTGEAGIPPDICEFLDQLKQLRQSADGVSADPAAWIGGMAELPEKFKALVDSASATLLPDKLDHLRRELREQLRGLASDGLLDDPGRAGAETAETEAEHPGRALPGSAAPAAGTARRAAGALEISPAARSPFAEIREAKPGAGDGRLAIATGDASPAQDSAAAALKPRAHELDSTAAGVSSSVALRAAHRHEGSRGSDAPESSRLADAISDRAGKVLESQQEPPADSGDFRQAAEEFLFSKTPAALDAAPEEGAAVSERFSLTPREPRPSPAAEGGSTRSADAAAALRDKETATGTVRSGVFDQIVQRAVVQVGNDHGEINIDLKPDFLGRVRMQIVTDNQQVSVRILTELPAVRDMIETGLQQLKSELQNHGLQVERLEVAVENDHRQQGWRQAKTARTWKADAAGDLSASDRSLTEGRWEPVYYRPRAIGTAAIDMFV